MSLLIGLYYLIGGLIILFLLLPTWTVLVSKWLGSDLNKMKSNNDFDYGIIITAYKNVEISKPLVRSLLDQKYKNCHVYLVADNADIRAWDIVDDRLSVMKPEPALNLKAKSIIYAIDRYVRDHDYSVIMDADNVVHPDFLEVINRYADAGYEAIQGQRTAKNLDTIYACADAVGEFYKNYVERYGPFLIGGSAVISGSGMAVKRELYNGYLMSDEIQDGQHRWKKMLQEDKILQNFLIRKNKKIAYAWDAVVFDEKVGEGEAVTTQRTRWLYSYFQNIPNSLGILRRGAFGGSFNQLYFGIVTIAPPILIMFGLASVLALIGIWVEPFMSIILVSSVAIFILTILWTLRLSAAPKKVWNHLYGMPLFMFRQIMGLFKMGNPNKNFKHTEHRKSVNIRDIIEKEKGQ